MFRSEARSDVPEVETVRRAEMLLEGHFLAVRRDREPREDSAAVVVHDDDRGSQPMAVSRYQAAQVVQEGEISTEQHDGTVAAGCSAQRARHQTIDAIGAAIAKHPQRPRRGR